MPRRTKYRLRRKKKYNTKRRRFRGGVGHGDQVVPQLNMTNVPRYGDSLRHGYDAFTFSDGRGPRHDHAPVPPEYVPPIHRRGPPSPHRYSPSASPRNSPTSRGRTVPDPLGKLEYFPSFSSSNQRRHSHIPAP